MKPTTNILRLEGLTILVASTFVYYLSDYAVWPFFVLLLAPDVFMVGYLKDTRLGALTYNMGHTLVSPALLAGLGYTLSSDLLYSLALIWLAHIGMDRAFGYGLKYTDHFKHTHLGWISGTPVGEDK